MTDIIDPTRPFERLRVAIRPEWVDFNGHMNVAYYVLVFDMGTDALYDALGIGESYRRDTSGTTFATEHHVRYLAEVREGQEVRIASVMVARDAKRVHYAHRMYKAADGALSATIEMISLHVDLSTRRVTPFPEDAAARIDRFIAGGAADTLKPDGGWRLALPRRT